MSIEPQVDPNVEHFADDALDKEFWRKLGPKFNIEGDVDDSVLEFSEEEGDKLFAKMEKEAYVQTMQPGLNSPLEDMRELLGVIEDNGMPPVFAFAFDEFWFLHRQVRSLVKILLDEDEFSMLPDFWCWRVKPGEEGWKPHRDKVRGSLFPDGSPKSITVWIALSEIHPLNSCMYIIPADRDAIYYNDGQNGFESRLPDMRALPGQAGDVFAWTQRVFHWGSHSAEEHHLPPRQSVAFEYQRCDVSAMNNPLLDPDKMPSFEERMALIAKQVLQYTHMYEFTPELIATAKEILERVDLPEESGKSLK